MKTDTSKTKPVGRFTVWVERAEPSPESQERWSRRAEALCAWLVRRWEEERSERECA